MSHKYLASLPGIVIAAVVACSSTGVELGKNNLDGNGGACADGNDCESSGGSTADAGTGGAPVTGGAGGGGGRATGGSPVAGGAGGSLATGGSPVAGGAGGELATGGGAGAPNCTVIGCGQAPICGRQCSEPCGCCGCAPDDFIMADNANGSPGEAAYQCAGDCFSPASYDFVSLATGAPRIAVVKKDENRGVCFRIVLGPSNLAGVHLVTNRDYAIEAVYRTNLENCDSPEFTVPEGAVTPSDAIGHVLLKDDWESSPPARLCEIDLDAQLIFDGSPVVKETLRSTFSLPLAFCPNPETPMP